MAAIQFDMNLAQHNVSWDDWINTAIALDGLSFGTFWGFDHLYPIGGDLEGTEHECYTTMAAAAAVTKRIRIGALVSGVMYRNPALQIKMATEIDVISNGRFDFGIGAAWAEREFNAFAIPFPEPKVRIATLRETLDLAKLLWSGDPRKKVTYEGHYVKAYDLFINPQPVQRPHPPIVIGGSGEQLTLRVVARHADVWHGFGDLATLKHKIEVIDGYAPTYGRSGSDIVKSTGVSIWVGDLSETLVNRLAQQSGRPVSQIRGGFVAGSPTEIEQRLRAYMDVGITRFIVNSLGPNNHENWRRVSDEIIPRFANG